MPRILIIDDDDLVRYAIAETLRRAGHEVIECAGAADGLRVMTEGAPDLCILDMIMPDQDGLETLTRMKGLGLKTPVLAISGGGRTGLGLYLQTASLLGAKDILSKPFDNEILLAKIEEMLAR